LFELTLLNLQKDPVIINSSELDLSILETESTRSSVETLDPKISQEQLPTVALDTEELQILEILPLKDKDLMETALITP
jgi:hypothetical protein